MFFISFCLLSFFFFPHCVLHMLFSLFSAFFLRIRSSFGEIKFIYNGRRSLLSKNAAQPLRLQIVFCYVWHVICSVLLTYLLAIIIIILDRSSRVETVEQNSDGEGSESSEETSDLWTLYKSVRKYTTNLGICLSDPFLRLPSKRFVSALALCRIPSGPEKSCKVTSFVFGFFRP